MKMTVRIPMVRLAELLQEKHERTIFSCLLWLPGCCRNCRLPVFFRYHFQLVHRRDAEFAEVNFPLNYNQVVFGQQFTELLFQRSLSIYQVAAISRPWVTENWGS